MGCPDDASAGELLRRALELGVRLIDTADLYAGGASEQRIAGAFHPYPREAVIATKGGYVAGPGGPVPDGRPAHLRAALDGSLQRLRLDAVDLYFLHTPDPAVPLRESLAALDELRTEGKIRHIGLSNVTAEQLGEGLAAVPVAAVQNGYNVRRGRLSAPAPDPVLAACEQAGIPFIAYVPLGTGRLLERDQSLHQVAARHAATPAQVALAWLLAQSEVVLPLPGTTSLAHLEQNMRAVELRLSDEDFAALGRRP
jgi:aryl-alcohol dehydrogenase-like predicted oxidoreductase